MGRFCRACTCLKPCHEIKTLLAASPKFVFMKKVFYCTIIALFLLSMGAEAANNARFISQSVPSGMLVGHSYNVSVSMKNTGTSTWTAAGNYRLGSSNPQNNINWGTGRAYLNQSDSIAPGQNKTFVFTVSPGTSGSINFQWRMLVEGVEWFGEYTPNMNLVYSDGISIQSPYSSKTHVYMGQMHDHSNNSDGAQTPSAVVTAYRSAGYDFISISDHYKITSDPGVSGILFIPGAEEAPKSPLRNYSYVNHMNRIGAVTPSTGSSGTPQKVIDQSLSEGSFVFLNHPSWPGGYPADPNWMDAELESVAGYYGVEVWNSLVAPNQNAENRIDYLLSKNKKLFLIAADDCHNLNSVYCKTASVRVFSDELTVQAIMENLKSGNFYASNGANISGIHISGKTFEITTDAASKIEFIVKEGVVRQSNYDVRGANYTVLGDETYVRAQVTRNSDGKMAWTNPIYSSKPAAISFVDPTPADNALIASGSIVTVKTNASGGTSGLDWDSTLLGWWRFNGAAGESAMHYTDWSTHSNDASCNGSFCPVDAAGKYGKALRFDGIDDCLTSSSFGDNTTALTVSAWINPSAGGYALSFASKDDLSSNRSWYFGLNNDTSFKVALWTTAGRKDTIANGLALREWAHVAFTYDGSSVNLYKNGVLAASNAISGPIVKTASPVKIGCINDLYNFNGTIDDVFIHNRALSPGEIKASYDSKNLLSADFAHLSQGNYSFQAYSQDVNGNTESTGRRNIKIAAATTTSTTTTSSTTSSTTTTTTSTTTTIAPSTTTTTTSSSTTTLGNCVMPGNYPPCDSVALSEVVDAINHWALDLPN
jgi:hypothetical protein